MGNKSHSKLKKYLKEIGANILNTTNKYEIVRFKINDATHVIYNASYRKQRQTGSTFSYSDNVVEQIHEDFFNLPKEKWIAQKKVEIKPLTKEEQEELENGKKHIRKLIDTFHREKMIQPKYLYRILAGSLKFMRNKQKYNILEHTRNIEDARKVYKACLQIQKYLLISSKRGEFIS